MTPTIETDSLTRTYGRTEALRGVTLAVPKGAVVALLGPNGAGKTTLLKLLIGLQRPTQGVARVLGRDSSRLTPADFQRIGYTSDEQRLPSEMNVTELFSYCRPLYPTWDNDLAARLRDLFALPRRQRLSQLSRGMRAKAALAISLAYRPELLLLDEPLSGIDIITREEIMQGVLELVTGEAGLTVLLSSHEIDDVERLADWAVILIGGELRTAEPLISLQARFRQVEIEGPGAAAAARSALPAACWLERKTEGSLRLTHTQWAGEDTLAELSRIFPTAALTTRSMSLRQIYRSHAHRYPAAIEKGEQP